MQQPESFMTSMQQPESFMASMQQPENFMTWKQQPGSFITSMQQPENFMTPIDVITKKLHDINAAGKINIIFMFCMWESRVDPGFSVWNCENINPWGRERKLQENPLKSIYENPTSHLILNYDLLGTLLKILKQSKNPSKILSS